MKSIKVSELTGAALDWAAAKCEYDNRRYNYGSPCFSLKTKQVYKTKGLQEIGVTFSPSTDWKQGGPIIEREGIAIGKSWEGWKAFTETSGGCGPTTLIAAMRCYVAFKLGDTIEVPEELL